MPIVSDSSLSKIVESSATQALQALARERLFADSDREGLMVLSQFIVSGEKTTREIMRDNSDMSAYIAFLHYKYSVMATDAKSDMDRYVGQFTDDNQVRGVSDHKFNYWLLSLPDYIQKRDLYSSLKSIVELLDNLRWVLTNRKELIVQLAKLDIADSRE